MAHFLAYSVSPAVNNILVSNVLGCQFGAEVGQIVPNRGKPGTFSDQISVHLGSPSPNVLKSDLKKSRIFPILANLESKNLLKSDLKKSWIFPVLGHFDPLWGQTGNPGYDHL